MECSSLQKREEEPWRVLEFYSGIGGMRYSLMKAGVNATLVEAFDINDTANDVYEHNFGHRPFQGNIQSLTAADLDCYGAHAWLLSPPCQPYTRQGLQKQSGDSRASSFLKILELIPVITQPPLLLFVENVVGFEISDTHEQMLEILAKIDFVTQEFILSPLQFGVPYSRPRYFCLAKRKPLSFQRCVSNAQVFWSPTLLFGNNDEIVNNKSIQAPEISDEMLQSCEPVARFMEHPNNHETCSLSDTNVSAEDAGSLESDDVEKRGNSSCQYFVPTSLIERWGSAMDIVYPDSKRCCCFTKSYYRYVKGTGSLLAIGQHEKKGKLFSLKEQSLRYFTPREVANLHSFPKDFQFPPHVSLRQRYALLGNSLSIAVVAPLLQYLFTE